jgi:hypothetical protein
MAGKSPIIGPVKRLPSEILATSTVQAKNEFDLEKIIRDCYVANRKYYVGDSQSKYGDTQTRWDVPSRKDGLTTWGRIARFLIEHNINDVHRYVHAQFAASDNPAALYPPFLIGGNALKAYHEYNSTADERLRSSLHAEISRFRTEVVLNSKPDMTTEECWRFVLMNSGNNISPLLRYLCAVDIGAMDLAKFWYDAAMLQVIMDPRGYIRVWDDCFSGRVKALITGAGILIPESK